MAFCGCRPRISALLLSIGLGAACGGCATAPSSPAATAGAPAATPAPAFQPGIELPDGRARDILFAACLDCHGLTALPLFKAFYTRDDWHALVVTMQGHGAAISSAEVEILADYLTQHFGVAPAAAASAQPN